MTRSKQDIEAGLALFQQILADIPGIGQEFEVSRTDFQSVLPSDAEEAALARRRHFEWYLLERDSKHLGGLPVEACMDTWLERAEPDVADMAEAMLHSFAGVFEVSSFEAGQGMWLSDIFGLGEYPTEPVDVALDIRPKDMIVGRIFPVGDGVYSLSLAASVFREPTLIKAVRRDLASLRESRRGVLRIGQQELERLFFEISVQSERDSSAGIDLGMERARAKQELLDSGLDDTTVREVMIEVTKASVSEDSGAVTRILNALAFEDEVDLGRAHRVLSALWAVEVSPVAKSPEARPKLSGKDGAQKVADVRAALAKFDEQKEAGVDVEELYEQLSLKLGISEPESEGPEITLPDFPGVVGAIIEEFLWDIERTQGAPVAMSLGRIKLLGDFGKDIGVFEELGKAHLLDFAGRWLLDEARLTNAEDARACLHALQEFCSWVQEQHLHPLEDECSEFLETLSKSIPRLLMLKQSCVAPEASHRPFDVKSTDQDQLTLVDENHRTHSASIERRLAEMIRPGDLLHGHIEGSGFQLSACYPGELRQLITLRRSQDELE